MNTRQTYYERETQCQLLFDSLGSCYHIWTPENFEVIFTTEEEFKAGMNIFALCCMLRPKVKILTFVLMSNHIHVTAAGRLEEILELIELFKKYLSKSFDALERVINWSGFTINHRCLESLDDVRNVIVYDNKNGFLVSLDHTPFSYPWGAGKYYFNPEAKHLSLRCSIKMGVRERRCFLNSRIADGLSNILWLDGVISPAFFCDIITGEQLFQNARQYFNKCSKNMEENKKIAQEIGESIFYTDDELFSLLCRTCRERYDAVTPGALSPQEKIQMAKMLRYEYNASSKQIQRMLKIQQNVLDNLGL